jgi:hypothetical protein
VARIPDVTNPDYLDGLKGWSLEEVRAHRAEVTEIETGLSYLRRIVQGRLDIVVAEQRHLRQGQSGDMSELIEELPAILSGKVRVPGRGRLTTLMAPAQVDPQLEARLEELLPADRLARLAEMSEAEFLACAAEMTEFERSVSAQRRAVLDVLDRLQEEIVRRFRTGEATVDSLRP